MEKAVIITLECGGLDVSDDRWEPFTSVQRAEKLCRIRSEADRSLSLGVELALCAALNMRGIPCRPPAYFRNEKGKPFLSNAPQFISLSHSGSLAVCAIADIPVGVDIETPRRVDGRIAFRVLSPEERTDRITAGELLRKWVVKESYLKLTGEGIAGSMNRVTTRDGMIFSDGGTAYYELRENDSPEYLLSCCCSEPFEAEFISLCPDTLFGLFS